MLTKKRKKVLDSVKTHSKNQEYTPPLDKTRTKCPACGQKEDPDGRCRCVNEDAW